MANPQNIVPHQFKKGQVPNPTGRPKGIPNAATRYQRILNLIEKVPNPVTGKIEEFTVAEVMDMNIIKKARKGDIKAYKEILDRLEGRPMQPVDHTTLGQAMPAPLVYLPEDLPEDYFSKKPKPEV